MAGRAELRIPHERLQEDAPVRLRIEIGEERIERLNIPVVAGGELMQRRVADRETGVAHGAIDVHDGVARHAAQARLGFRRIDLLANGAIEASVEENRVVVAPGAPFARTGAHHVLHVLDGLPVKLVVKRCEMVGRTLPLLVDILVAFAAGLRIHKEVRRNNGAGIGLGGRRCERGLRAGALLIHGRRNGHGVPNAVVRIGPQPVVERARRRQAN